MAARAPQWTTKWWLQWSTKTLDIPLSKRVWYSLSSQASVAAVQVPLGDSAEKAETVPGVG